MAFEQDYLYPLTLFVDEETNRVIVAEASAEFVDTLFSILTLPLGTIIRLVSNDKKDQNNNLYKTVENLDTQEMLLRPRNPCETLCQKLRYNVDDTERTKYFMCGSCRGGSDLWLSTFVGLKCCSCGQPMDREMKLHEEHIPKDCEEEGGVFIKGSTMYFIFDDLKVLQNSAANPAWLQRLHQTQINDDLDFV